jgi:hypothetical protein
VKSWEYIEAPRKVKWPKGTHITRTDGYLNHRTRVLDKDVFEGDTAVFYTTTEEDGSQHSGDRISIGRVERLYVAGDTLPAGEPMPANGVVEYPNGGKLYYEEAGDLGTRYDRKIIWLEGVN